MNKEIKILNTQYSIINNKIYLLTDKKPKPKITGTNFAAILDKNEYSSPFIAWCLQFKIYKEHRDEQSEKRLKAGEQLEKTIIEYLNTKKNNRSIIYTPEMCNFHNKNYDFFSEIPIFGGKWDALLQNTKTHTIQSVIEIKTTNIKNKMQWIQEGPPIYYKLQVALYAYLLNIKHVTIVVSFLEEQIYDKPEKFQPTKENTKLFEFLLRREFPNFEEYIKQAKKWWSTYIETRESPEYNKNKNQDIEIFKKLNVEFGSWKNTPIEKIIEEYEQNIECYNSIIKREHLEDIIKKIDSLKESLKKHIQENISLTKQNYILQGTKYEFIFSKKNKVDINKELLEQDGILEQYKIQKEVLQLHINTIEKIE